MKSKPFIIPIIIVLLGLVFTITGSLFKIMHWSFAPEIYILGNLLLVLGLIATIIKLYIAYRKH